MKDVMLDLETLGNGKNACVTQIGACYFDRVTGEIGAEFKVNVDAHTALRSGAEMDASTVYWWLKQSRQAIDSMIAPPLQPIDLAFEALNIFLEPAKAIWSHATFDFVIISETFKRLNMTPKFRYTTARDIRTLVDLAHITFSKTPRDGVHHDALDDCKHQVKYCVEAMNKIKNRIQNV